ncbi:LamG-like jellyroll fold domain-containing protein [Cohnella sp. GCM10027633]|uniref:LamG-like jellyroll fold domain-containing protein n=1 Tax=unclassified Cohnella TaxID=2636738 RepID=UPI00363C56C4
MIFASRRVSAMLIAIILCSLMLESACTPGAARGNAAGAEQSGGKTYYVDAASGNDANAGTSANAAWQSLAKVNGTTFQPGDRILFKAGSSWTGQLWPKGSGTSTKPIVIDKYGTGAKPAFHGAGQVQETVKLYNQQYWEINNLEITNTAVERATRRAVWIEAHDTGVTRHIYLKNLDIRDVSGQTAVQDLESGGIIVRVTGSATPTKFDDVLIQDNTFTDVDATGIFIRSDWRNRATRTDGSGPWLGMTNIVIKGNSLNRTGGDAIIVCETESALIEHNVAAYSYYDSVGYHAAIWAINSDNALFQYNEAHHTQNTLDGMGFDIDELCNGCVMQYNYSHDNAGGFMLLVGQRGGDGQGYDQNGIVRYNVSENDGTALIQAVGRMQNYQIYNNTFYTGEGMNVRFLMAPDGNNLPQGTLSFKNNIIYNLGQNMTYYCGNATCAYDSNTYYGNHDPSEPATDPHKLTTDPMFIGAGSGRTGRGTVDGYRLAEGSPALGSGTLISGNGGKDYWGNTVSSSRVPNRGAYDGQGTEEENVGGGIHSYVFDRDGEEARMIWSAEPNAVSVKTNKRLTVADAEGDSRSYEPDNGNFVYLSTSVMPLDVSGRAISVEQGGKYALRADDAFVGDDVSLTLTVDNSRPPRAPIDGKLAFGESVVPFRAGPGETVEVEAALPGFDTAGSKRLAGDILNGGKRVGRVSANIRVEDPIRLQAKQVLKDGAEALRIEASNVSDRSRIAESIAWTIGDASGTLTPNAAIAAGSAFETDLPLAGFEPSRTYPVTITLRMADGLTYAYEGNVSFFATLTEMRIVIDGVPDDLAAIPAIRLTEHGTVRMTGYGGESDLSGDVWLTWDDEHLNVSAAIRDDAFSQEQSGSQIWLGDALQFAVSPGMPGDSADMYEYGMALTPDGPQLYRWSGIGLPGGLVENAELSVTRDESAKETYYELSLPWTELAPIDPEDGLFSLSLLANDNDGSGRKGWIEWGAGIGGSKDPSLFMPVRLDGPVDRLPVSMKINDPLAYSAIPLTLTLTGTYDDGFASRITHAAWETSDPAVATVHRGVVTFTGRKGSVTITASYEGLEASASAAIEELGQYYPFDEGQGTRTTDSVGGVARDIEGEPVWVDGKKGKALFFYGNSVRINPIADEDFTFMAWIKPASDSYNHMILGQGVTGSQANMFNWWISNGQMYFLVSDAEGAGHGMWPFNTEPGSIPLNEWTHVAATREGNEFKLYVNGANVLSKSVDYHQNQLLNPNQFRIGAQNGPSGGPSEGFHGAIDELRLYPRTLTDEEIFALSQVDS